MTRAHVALLLLAVLGVATSGCYRHHHHRSYRYSRYPRARVVYYAPAPVIYANTVIVYGAQPGIRVQAPAPQQVIVQAPAPRPVIVHAPPPPAQPAPTVVVVTPPGAEDPSPAQAPAPAPQQPEGWYDEE
jgi:hypothetical protein